MTPEQYQALLTIIVQQTRAIQQNTESVLKLTASVDSLSNSLNDLVVVMEMSDLADAPPAGKWN